MVFFRLMQMVIVIFFSFPIFGQTKEQSTLRFKYPKLKLIHIYIYISYLENLKGVAINIKNPSVQ